MEETKLMVATILTVVFSHISYMGLFSEYWPTVHSSEYAQTLAHASDLHLDYVGRVALYRGFQGLYGAHGVVVGSHSLETAYWRARIKGVESLPPFYFQAHTLRAVAYLEGSSIPTRLFFGHILSGSKSQPYLC